MSDMTKAEIEGLAGKTIADVYVHLDGSTSVGWVSLTFTDGTEVEISAHGEHTDGWPIFELGRRIRDIYGVKPAERPKESDG